MSNSLRTLVGTFLALASQAVWSLDLSGRWTLTVENLDHTVVAAMTVRFTQEAARSCLGGSWRQVEVESPTSTDARFFPVTEPLSYSVEESTLTIGRNEVCDAYLHLTGKLGKLPVRGDYVGFGWGSARQIGHFSLDRAP